MEDPLEGITARICYMVWGVVVGIVITFHFVGTISFGEMFVGQVFAMFLWMLLMLIRKVILYA